MKPNFCLQTGFEIQNSYFHYNRCECAVFFYFSKTRETNLRPNTLLVIMSLAISHKHKIRKQNYIMKCIIDRKLYDTDVSELIHETKFGGYDCSDPHFVAEHLYRTNSGAYFLCGEGGAFSQYGVSPEPGCCEVGAEIIPLGDGDAYEWLEKTNAVDAIQRCFADYIVDA
jgi:hypothetical protein